MNTQKKTLSLIFASFAMTALLSTAPLLQAPSVLAEENGKTPTTGMVCADCDTSFDVEASLTDKEKLQLKEAYEKVDKLSAEISKLYDENNKVKDQAKLDDLEKQLANTLASVQHIQDKLDAENEKTKVAEVKESVNKNKDLTNAEKILYLKNFNKMLELEKEVDSLVGIRGDVKDKGKLDRLKKELEGVYQTLDALDVKIENAKIRANPNLSDAEKKRIIAAYNKIARLEVEIAKHIGPDGKVTDEKKVESLDKEVERIANSIKDIEGKICYPDSEVIPY